MEPDRDIVLFDWDVQQRLNILTGKKPGVGTEAKRYVEWYDKFGANFVTELRGKLAPQHENPSRLFTPATYKILRCAFSEIPKDVFLP